MRNPFVFSQKNPNFERFEQSYYFSTILRQTCYILLGKSRSEKMNENRLREGKWLTLGKTTHRVGETHAWEK